jgi:hypothetical protein
MNNRIQARFVDSVAVILFITGATKFISALGAAQTLDEPDSLLILSHRHIFFLMSALELGLSAYLLMGRNTKMKLALVAWLATNFLVYRIGLWWMGAPNLCNCLGNLDQFLPLSPLFLNIAALASLGWLLAGSYALMIIEWCNRPAEVCVELVPQNSGA